MDNMESVLLPPFLAERRRRRFPQEAGEELDDAPRPVRRGCSTAGETRLVFTSREALARAVRHERQPPRAATGWARRRGEAGRARARARAAAAPALASDAAARGRSSSSGRRRARPRPHAGPAWPRPCASRGVESDAPVAGRADGRDGAAIPWQPGAIGRSPASSFRCAACRRRNQERCACSAVFHGGVDLDMLRMMMALGKGGGGLAGGRVGRRRGWRRRIRYNHLTLNPALCPYLCGRLDAGGARGADGALVETMRRVCRRSSCSEQSRDTEVAATLTVLELAEPLRAAGPRAAGGRCRKRRSILATSLYSLLQMLGKPRLLERVARARDAAAGGAGRHLESRAVRGGTDPYRAAACRRATARGVRRCAAAATAGPGSGRAGLFGRRLRSWRWPAACWPACC